MTAHPPIRPANGIVAGIASSIEDFIDLRRDLHAHPELAFNERRTSARIAELLVRWGYEVSAGLAGTGVVATLSRGDGDKRLGIRADIDALPIAEQTDLDYASTNPGVMHACGHDGHTAILLAAARHLAGRGRFSGTLTLIFQPAEEIGAGARRMLDEGLFDKHPVDAVFALHNWPGVAAGKFGFVTGPAMASVDQAIIRVVGKGGHGAAPHETVDPVVVASHIVVALQTIVSRSVDPLDMAVVTVGSIHGGSASNVIPDEVELKATIRSYRPELRAELQRRIPGLVRAQAQSFGAVAEVDYRPGFPSVVNHAAETEFAHDVALLSFGPAAIDAAFRPRTASEDFAYMLEARPGSYLFVGNGEGPPLHNPRYDFNDAIIAPAAAYWVALAEAFLTA
jgi:hippurate hydrolase